MVTMLDCINRFPGKINPMIKNRKSNFEPVFKMLNKGLHTLNQIVLIGSGSSNTAAITARGFIEKAAAIQTICMLSNEFLNNCYVYNPTALYVFTSQTGTSNLTLEAVKKVKQHSPYVIGLTQGASTALAKKVNAHVDLGCGIEEYDMRTLGYCCSVFTLMLMGIEIGYRNGSLDELAYHSYLEEAKLVEVSHQKISAQAMQWFDQNKEQLMNSDTFTIYGNKSLYGVALEAAIKILELSKRKLAVGYEMDDGMHGPTMGFTYRNCVIALNDGGTADNRTALVQWAKDELHNGFMVGQNCIDEKDFAYAPVTENFLCLEFAPFIQILGYRLAIDNGVDLLDISRHKEFTYFSIHQEAWNQVQERE